MSCRGAWQDEHGKFHEAKVEATKHPVSSPPPPTKRQELHALLSQLEDAAVNVYIFSKQHEDLIKKIQELMEEKDA